MTPIKNMYKLTVTVTVTVTSERLAAAQAQLHFRLCKRDK